MNPTLANEERLRQFLKVCPYAYILGKEYCKEQWEKFIKTYRDGVVRL